MQKTSLQPEDWDRLGAWFDRFCDQPPDKRDLSELEDERARHPELIELLEQMLDAATRDDADLLDRTLHHAAGYPLGSGASGLALPDFEGRRFGPWLATEEIGRGGMALVLKGERADGQFEKDVAIKLLASSAEGMHQQFEDEIRLLARLDHPNIARLIDGGIDAEGRPYLVMEYVRGTSITDFVDQHALGTPRRIALLQQVIDAVSFAHRQLIVHCDLKPSNVLVNAEGQVKLLDFGIAGLISATAERQLETPRRGVLCSPGYCAPEQFEGASPAPAQDIHGLGALLFELLTGQRPRNAATITRLLFGTQSSPLSVPSPRQIDAAIDADLDAICLRALAHRADDRYRSADALNQDLINWLELRPVEARDAGPAYVWKKWLRRHWLPTASITAVIVALAAGALIAMEQRGQAIEARVMAESELARAGAINAFVVSLFEGAQPGAQPDAVPTTRELLVRGAESLQERLRDHPQQRGDLLTLVGRLMISAGLNQEAVKALLAAVQTREQTYDPGAWPVAEARKLLGEALHYSDRIDEAITQLELAVAALESADRPTLLADSLHALAYALSTRPDFNRVLDLHRRAITIQRPLADPESLASGLTDYARSLQRAGELQASARAYEEAITIQRARPRFNHYTLSLTLSDYGVTLRRLSRFDEAEAVLREALQLSEGIFAGPHPALGQRWNSLGAVLVEQDRRVEAIHAFEKALSILESLNPTDNDIPVAGPLNNIGFLYLSIGEYAAAEEVLRRALTIVERNVGQNHPYHIAVSHNLGRALMGLGRAESARTLLTDTLIRAEEYHAGDLRRLAGFRSTLGQLLWHSFQDRNGLQMIEQAFDSIEGELGSAHLTTAQHAQVFGEALLDGARPEAAEALFQQALQITEAQLSPHHHRVLQARIGLAESQFAQDRTDAAHRTLELLGPLPATISDSDPLRQRLAELAARSEPPDHSP
mgnify:CR=1 FL=1